MKVNTALAFIAAGVSLWLLTASRAGSLAFRIGQGAAVVSGLLGLLNLAEYVLGVDLGIDQLLFEDVETAPVPPGRMSAGTALTFVLTGPALLLLSRQDRRRDYFAQLLSLVAVLPPLFSATGYLYSLESLYMTGQYGSMALHTALGLLVLCTGVLLARPDSGLMAVVASEGPAGLLARRMVPAVVGVPALLGWLLLTGYRAGYLDVALALALFALVSALVFALVVWSSTWALQSLDVRRREGEAALARLAAIVESSSDAIIGKTWMALSRPGTLPRSDSMASRLTRQGASRCPSSSPLSARMSCQRPSQESRREVPSNTTRLCG